ncbi:Pimeloyl-ACP methyl ester carboxylesterase [Thermomonospora echinospora]|uniref:Pimeloyl-ACP methyl ester carboxylesterase n=1 Tax=Thermomonospora echinospora TaxID=1992 RepID=A0A1H5U3Y9_9ACTN|nr:alpha/beta hydrolase [Thermomonospora echinospora]SEF68997.1 Pimeloyl-ACP methyl ester carboxylesterase [Thermomonospora echinospora]
MRSGYLTLPSGQLHLRQAGAGSPVVLLHDAPGSSAVWDTAMIEEVARARWVIAPDLIGFGGTTAAGDAADLDAQATALATALTELGVRRAPVAAEGAGAAVAARLAERHPGLVQGILVLRVPYHGAEQPPAQPEADAGGGHLLRLYDEIRDGILFAPWWRPKAANRRRRGLPPAPVLHELFLDTAEHGDAHRRLAASAAKEWPHLAGTPGMVLAGDDWTAGILALPEGDGVPLPVDDAQGEREYLQVGSGVIHVRRFGDGSSGRRPVLALHANPGSGDGLEPLARALGKTRQVIVWDTPGHGRSTPLPEDVEGGAPTLAGTYAPLLVELLDALGVEECDVYGTHTGAGLAVELAIAAPNRVGALVLDGVPLFDDQPELVASVLANYFVDLTPDPHGSHLRRAWGVSADMALWWPWFEHTPEGVRDVDPYRPDFLHRVTLDMLRSAPHYHRYYRAGWQWPCTRRLPLVRRPALVGSTLTDPLAPMTPVALRLLADAAETTFAPLGGAGSPELNAALMARYLDGVR